MGEPILITFGCCVGWDLLSCFDKTLGLGIAFDFLVGGSWVIFMGLSVCAVSANLISPPHPRISLGCVLLLGWSLKAQILDGRGADVDTDA